MNQIIDLVTFAWASGKRTHALGGIAAGFLLLYLTSDPGTWPVEYIEEIMVAIFGAKFQTMRLAMKNAAKPTP